MPSDRQLTRRAALGAIGVAAGTGVALAGRSRRGVSRTRPATTDPTTEWATHYRGAENDYNFDSLAGKYGNKALVATADGGYAIAADGHDISKTERTGPHIALIKIDAGGGYEWHTFVKDGRGHESNQRGWDLFQTDGGGFVVGGDRDYAMQVAELDGDGSEQWFTELEADDNVNDEYPRIADLEAVAPAHDGGYVVAGTQTYEVPALTKLDADGNVVWDERYFTDENGENEPQGRQLVAFARAEDGYVFVSRTTKPRVLSKVDVDGNLLWSEELASDVLYLDVEVTDDGGYVLTGDDYTDGDSQNFVLERRDADRNREWLKEYDGPFEGDDRSQSVTRTDDGGYGLSGRMEAAYSGDTVAAVLKTDGEGNEAWRKLITTGESDNPWAVEALSVTDTADGGLAVVDDPYQSPVGAAKVAPSGGDSSTATATPTDSPTDTGTTTDSPTQDGETTTGNTATPTATDTQTSTATATAGRTVQTTTGGETGGGGPGFGVVTAVAGVASVVAYYLRGGDGDTEG